MQDTINTAQGLIYNTIEGVKPGQYVAGSKAALAPKLAAAKATLADAGATQLDVHNATADLNAANNTYQGNVIKEVAVASLMGFWKMNGNADDSSGNKNNGTLTKGDSLYGAGMPAATADRFGRAGLAYHFDKGGNIEVPYKTSLNPAQLSISLWCKKDTAGRTCAVTFKQDTMNFYINGNLTASWTGATSPGSPIVLATPINFTIGQGLPTDKYLTVDGDYQVKWGGFWTGDTDDVMFYNVALDATQVKAIFVNQNTL